MSAVEVPPELVARAEAWLAQDPDEETAAELRGLIDAAVDGRAGARGDLASRFSGRLAFGTAGLRGELGAGPMRMNRVLVAQAAAGIGAFLLGRERQGTPSVVIGYDGRKNSRIFAADSAELLQGAGVDAVLLPSMTPTPVLASAVRRLGADAGIMVTASHNPPRDNGYKVYLGGEDGGAQIVSPVDGRIAERIEAVAAGDGIHRLPRSTGYRVADAGLVDDYVAAAAAVVSPPAAPLRIVYTAMHGVGWEVFSRAASAAGHADVRPVLEQRDPDPGFPTVAYPNPEEPGAMDLALRDAAAAGADIVIANDPDADRVSAAIPDGAGGWRQLTGNEVGWLLGWRAAERAVAAGDTDAVLACTIVSSPALRAVAKAHGLGFAETLTGFKWVSRTPNLRFGYEEALGYLVDPDLARDKDGVTAGLAMLEIAAEAKAAGSSVAERLEEFASRFGRFASNQVSIRVSDLTIIARVMAALRAAPPAILGGLSVEGVDDLSAGLAGLPATDALRFRLEGGSRVMARPSGTEPKLKFYVDVQGDGDLAALLAAIEADLREIAAGA